MIPKFSHFVDKNNDRYELDNPDILHIFNDDGELEFYYLQHYGDYDRIDLTPVFAKISKLENAETKLVLKMAKNGGNFYYSM